MPLHNSCLFQRVKHCRQRSHLNSIELKYALNKSDYFMLAKMASIFTEVRCNCATITSHLLKNWPLFSAQIKPYLSPAWKFNWMKNGFFIIPGKSMLLIRCISSFLHAMLVKIHAARITLSITGSFLIILTFLLVDKFVKNQLA